jgi:polyphosphate kinase
MYRPITQQTVGRTIESAGAVDLDRPELYVNRELSWLEFNQRVLDQAIGDEHPLLERVKFLAIACSNLDEFFMVRVAALLRKTRANVDQLSIDGMTVPELLVEIRRRVSLMTRDTASCWNSQLRPALAKHGVRLLEPQEYTAETRRYLASYFRSEIFPLLTPLAFDPGHPFPIISSRCKNFAVVVSQGGRTKFARVKIPPPLPRFIPVPRVHTGQPSGEQAFAFLEDVVRANLGDLFPGVEIVDAHLFRVLRDTDVGVPDEGADDLLASMDRSLKEMKQAPPSLLQVEASMPKRVLNTLVENFEVEEDIVVRTVDRLDYSDWMALHRLPLPHLRDPVFVPRVLWDLRRDVSIFDDIRERDWLVHHPFDSFAAVEGFLKQASVDPQVVAIKMTLYRIGQNSPLIDMLIAAADAGKQVAVLVELKARFDERNNIQWATRLEDAGVHVVYGVEDLKTHCKLCLVVRHEADGVRRYVHVGTGNYNRATSQVYTDLGLFTADPGVLDDVLEVFNYLTGYSRRRDYSHLLVAPVSLRAQLGALIDREIDHAMVGRPARIIVKNNAITDPAMIRCLYRASQAGVDVDLIVRGACCLRTGVPGVSDRIRVRSIVGRFLEHSRAYYFENGGRPDLYIGSADLMERNLDRRVEVLCPVRSPALADHLRALILDACLRDNVRAYALRDRSYHRLEPTDGEPAFSAQQALLQWYGSRSSEEEAAALD